MHSLVMTGATAGIGRSALDQLLERDRDLHVIVLARASSGATLVSQLGQDAQRVTVVEVDLSNMGSVLNATREVRSLLDMGVVPPLTAIAANGGVSLSSDTQQTADGYETTFAINVLANHLLVAELTPVMQTPARIVITSSDTHFGTLRHGGMKPAWAAPSTLAMPGAHSAAGSRAGSIAYSTSKLATIYLVHEWARRLPTGVEIIAYNPGLVPGTQLSRDASPTMQAAFRIMTPLMTTLRLADTVDGAGQKLATAILDPTDATSGAYIDRTRTARSSAESYDTTREHELWTFAEAERERFATT